MVEVFILAISLFSLISVITEIKDHSVEEVKFYLMETLFQADPHNAAAPSSQAGKPVRWTLAPAHAPKQ
ncbi:MAG: hypothetical protein V4634_01295 [Pseudomonadota bacterium]